MHALSEPAAAGLAGSQAACSTPGCVLPNQCPVGLHLFHVGQANKPTTQTPVVTDDDSSDTPGAFALHQDDLLTPDGASDSTEADAAVAQAAATTSTTAALTDRLAWAPRHLLLTASPTDEWLKLQSAPPAAEQRCGECKQSLDATAATAATVASAAAAAAVAAVAVTATAAVARSQPGHASGKRARCDEASSSREVARQSLPRCEWLSEDRTLCVRSCSWERVAGYLRCVRETARHEADEFNIDYIVRQLDSMREGPVGPREAHVLLQLQSCDPGRVESSRLARPAGAPPPPPSSSSSSSSSS